MTKLTNGFLIFTLTSYNKSLATRQGLGCDVIARVDGRRSLAQIGRVDTEAPGKRGRQGDKGTRGQGEGEKISRSSFPLCSLSPCPLVSPSPFSLFPLFPFLLFFLPLFLFFFPFPFFSPSPLKNRLLSL